MKTLLKIALASLIGLAAVSPSYALSFDVNSLAVMGPVDGNTPKPFYYKFQGGEEGPGKDLLGTVLSNGGLTATVSWDANLYSFDFESIYLKSSNRYIWWDVSGVNWSLYDGFTVSNTVLKNDNDKLQKISHISVTGEQGPPTQVPDGASTLVLLGLALSALGFVRRFRAVA